MKSNRRSLISGFIALLLLAAVSPAFSQATGDTTKHIKDLQALIQQKGAKWTAGETSLSNLPMSELLMRVGLNMEALPNGPQLPAIDVKAPGELDWRNADGGNYVTPVKNQMKCGSCWAFAMAGGVESYVLINQHKPGTDLDLAEQILVSCSGIGSCQGGTLWNADYLADTGIPPESFYPYTATDGTCPDNGWQKEAYKVGSWGIVWKNLELMKSYVTAYGPLPTAFYVFEDFINYKSGIYSYVSGKKLGGHAVLLVGFNDAEKYFIVKNSWDTTWGDNGYFKIAYSQMNNEVSFGLQTIAYMTKNGKGDVVANPALGSMNADTTWRRTSPMFNSLQQWN